MSHFIQNTLPLEGKTLMEFTQKTFIKPNFQIMARASTQPDAFNFHPEMLNKLCTKLTGKQSLRLDKQNQDMFQNYKKKLKNRRKSTFPSGSQIIQDIFTRDQDRSEEQKQRRKTRNHINVLKYLQKMPEKIYLHQRYNNAINQKLNIMAEMKEIIKKKENYRQWANENNNSPIKNPNFTKMTFLLEKLVSDKDVVKNLEESVNSQSCQRLNKLLNSGQKIKSPSHKHVKSCIPNVTLEPIAFNSYQAKTHNKWVEDIRATRDTEQGTIRK